MKRSEGELCQNDFEHFENIESETSQEFLNNSRANCLTYPNDSEIMVT